MTSGKYRIYREQSIGADISRSRHTLICNMISYVEHYRPLYFMIENVTGLLSCSLKGKQQGKRIVGGIEAGIVKFIMRSLTSLG